MTENCMLECQQWQQKIIQFQRFPLTDSMKDELYDLNLSDAMGHEVRFEEFEGYVSAQWDHFASK